jgi:hypothetical protein
MRDRLVELYAKAKRNAWGQTFHSDLERNMYIADYLIANDVVPVVRCKDCKHFNIGMLGFNWCDAHSYDELIECKENDYCSYGERRSNDD